MKHSREPQRLGRALHAGSDGFFWYTPRMSSAEFSNVTVSAKANVYFDGKVVSHTLRFPDGSKKTIGLIYPGEYHFSTDAAERMEIIAGAWRVKLDGSQELVAHTAPRSFDVPAKSGFTVTVDSGIAEYVCSFL
jgi:purine/pyrimidine-nucleoside phosphorylase